jgi:putative polyketide hydroxylase
LTFRLVKDRLSDEIEREDVAVAGERQEAVLIVGAGPAGLAAALTLSGLGVDPLVVERRRDRAALPRATAVSTRSMELVRAWGAEDEVRAGAVEVDFVEWSCRTLAEVASGFAEPVGYPSRGESALVSPVAPACVPQDHLEPILLERLRARGAARVELGTEVAGLEAGPDGVRATLRDVAGGRTRTVHARFLVGADGARSGVRAALGIPMRGPDNLREAVTAVFRAPLWEALGAHRYGLYWVTHPEATGLFLPAGRGDRWVYGVGWDPGQGPPGGLDEGRLAELIRVGSGIDGLRPEIERTGTFTFAAQLADRFREGSAFLAGDAAHRVTPRGGTGMNLALHDGHDLGWKLGWVLRGWAGPGLLASYEAERRPVVEHNLARSADPNGTIRDAADGLWVDLGGRIPHVWQDSGAGRVSTLDLLGPGLTLFTAPEGADWARAAAAPGTRVPVTTARLDAMSARVMGIARGGALLARPDGAPLALWPRPVPAPGTALRGAIASAGLGLGPVPARERAVA